MNNNGQNKLFFFFTPPKINNHINTENENSNKKEIEETEKNYYFGNTDKEEIGKGFIHYTTAVACAANKKYGITHYLGACDKEKVIPDIENDLKEKSDAENICWAEYNENMNSDEILKSIFSNIDLSDCSEIVIAINSGIRNNVMFFSVISQIMSYRGINIRLLYVKKFDDNNEHIIDVTEQNKYFDVLRAVELFTETGNPKKLKEQYKDEKELDTLFNYMDRFYKSIQVCRPVNNSENNIVKVYRSMMNEIGRIINNPNNNIPVIMRFLLPEIKKRFTPCENLDNHEFLQIVNWCYKNDMITISFFILGAEIDEYIRRNNWIKTKQKISPKDLSFLLDDCTAKISEEIIKGNDVEASSKKILENNGIFYSQNALKSILISQLIRHTRNSMAHSNKLTGILGDDKYYSLSYLIDNYEKKPENIKLYEMNKNNIPQIDKKVKKRNISNYNLRKNRKEIVITGNNTYEIYRELLKCILDDLMEMVDNK